MIDRLLQYTHTHTQLTGDMGQEGQAHKEKEGERKQGGEKTRRREIKEERN
jgi:hypothetical protein